jgi:hypothetical protein
VRPLTSKLANTEFIEREYMNKRHKRIAGAAAGVLAAVCGVVASTTVAGGTPAGNQSVVTGDGKAIVAIDLPAMASANVPGVTDSVWKQVDGDVPGGLKSIENGRELLNDNGRGIALVPSHEVGLCMSLLHAGNVVTESCFPGVTDAGIHVQYNYQSGQPIEVYGVASDGVDNVTINTDDGASHRVAVRNGAFLWVAADADTLPTSLESTNAGERNVESALFDGLAATIAEQS